MSYFTLTDMYSTLCPVISGRNACARTSVFKNVACGKVINVFVIPLKALKQCSYSTFGSKP